MLFTCLGFIIIHREVIRCDKILDKSENIKDSSKIQPLESQKSFNSSIFRSEKGLLRNHMMTNQLLDSRIEYTVIIFIYGNNTF